MSSDLQLLLILALLIGVSKLCGHLSLRYLKLPMVFGEIVGGVLLGPTLLDLQGRWPGEPWKLVPVLAGLGVLFLMFVAGLETNTAQLRRVSGVAFWTAFLGVLLPFAGGLGTALLFGMEARQAIFIGAALTATSVSISVQTLLELGQLQSREGATILGAAVIDDVMGLLVLSFIIAFSAAGADASRLPARLEALCGLPHPPVAVHILVVLLCMAAFFLLAWLVGMRLGPVLALAKRLHASYAVPAAAIVLLCLFAVTSDLLGQVAGITGAYLAGLFVGRTAFRDEVDHAVRPITYAFLVPIFFMSLGFTTNLRGLAGSGFFPLVIVVVAVGAKIIGCGAGARLSGFTAREALRVGAGMVSRGEVDLIIALIGVQYGIIHAPTYAALILTILASTLVTPLLLRATFPHLPPAPHEEIESIIPLEIEGEAG